MKPRIPLSTPHLSGGEQERVAQAFASNWIAPLGPHVEAFEREFAAVVGARHATAVSSGTAGLHLALHLAGVGPGDEVLVSTLTFVASVNPVLYLGGRPSLVDSERRSWNMDPALLAQALDDRARAGRPPRAVVVAHVYGQSADLAPIVEACARHGVALVEDAAEALGADYRGQAVGTFGQTGVFSFNGNKVITTSGGGMLVSDDGALVAHAHKLATQARETAPYYQHAEIGYNYRLSNVLAAIGRAQLEVLDERVAARRRNFERYRQALDGVPGLEWMPEAPWGRHSRWLTCLTVDRTEFGMGREALRLALEAENIEARPVWKPMHLQPLCAGRPCEGGAVAEDLFARGLCLPSGSNLADGDLERVADAIRAAWRHARRGPRAAADRKSVV